MGMYHTKAFTNESSLLLEFDSTVDLSHGSFQELSWKNRKSRHFRKNTSLPDDEKQLLSEIQDLSLYFLK